MTGFRVYHANVPFNFRAEGSGCAARQPSCAARQRGCAARQPDCAARYLNTSSDKTRHAARKPGNAGIQQRQAPQQIDKAAFPSAIYCGRTPQTASPHHPRSKPSIRGSLTKARLRKERGFPKPRACPDPSGQCARATDAASAGVSLAAPSAQTGLRSRQTAEGKAPLRFFVSHRFRNSAFHVAMQLKFFNP